MYKEIIEGEHLRKLTSSLTHTKVDNRHRLLYTVNSIDI